jgi:hypothetical protein
MTENRSRLSHEPDRLPYTNAAARRVVRTTIGSELRAHYELRHDLPHGMLTLLMQLNEREHEEEAASVGGLTIGLSVG